MFCQVSLPSVPAGKFDYSYQILGDGTLAILRTSTDIRGAFARKHRYVANPFHGTAHISLFDGDGEVDGPTIPMVPHPLFDRMHDNGWLIASSRRHSEPNGFRYDSGGHLVGRLDFGDGIEHLHCAPDGSIWIGYFDEGIYGYHPNQEPRPLPTYGLVQLSEDCRLIWSVAEVSEEFVDDCYALGLDENRAWACYFSDFPIISVENGTFEKWANPVTGASAIAGADGFALLAGGYGAAENDLTLLRLNEDRAEVVGRAKLPGERLSRHVFGRNGVIHVIADGKWHQAAVRKAVAEMVD